jgi:hypothetical protein
MHIYKSIFHFEIGSSNFLIERIIEPLPTKEFEAADPLGYEKLLKFPLFLFVRAIRR